MKSNITKVIMLLICWLLYMLVLLPVMAVNNSTDRELALMKLCCKEIKHTENNSEQIESSCDPQCLALMRDSTTQEKSTLSQRVQNIFGIVFGLLGLTILK